MVAPRKTTDDRDVISQLADKGEETLRHLVDRPRRMMDGAIHGFEERLHDIATRLRAIDPLERRVAAIEKRLDALEKPAGKTAARRSSPRAKPSTAAASRTAVATEPGRPDDAGRAGDDVARERERDADPASGERKPAE